MFHRSAVALFLLGCNEIYGLDATRARDAFEGGNGELLLDVDLDGVSDEVDPCLAPMRDGLDDLDEDSLPAAMDPCPLDAGMLDMDGDMLPDVCDPFPALGGDRMRCFMSFGSTDLNAKLWKPREMPTTWTSREGELLAGIPMPETEMRGVVATLGLEVPTQTSFETFVTLSNSSVGTQYAFRMWARAADTKSAGDLGCELSGDVNLTRLAVVRGADMDIASTSLVGVAFPRATDVRIRMTIAPGGDGVDIRCTFEWPTITPRSVKAHVAGMVPGRFGFDTQNLQANVSALAIYERDAIAPLP